MQLKRVLITGANSYIGTNVEKWLMKEPENFYVETLDMRDPNWKDFDFSKFDVVFHVAGIAHVSTKKSMKDLYFKVNRDLTIETAIKAKESGVKQFIFMSSMIVYNSKETRITLETKPNPDNFYGFSKLQAEEGILPLQSDSFNVCILRPPMIYGPGSKGNLPKLVELVSKIRVFPMLNNSRSILFVSNLQRIVSTSINLNLTGVFLLKNEFNPSTTELVSSIMRVKSKKMLLLWVPSFMYKMLMHCSYSILKAFDSYYYDFDCSLMGLDGRTYKIEMIAFHESLLDTYGTSNENTSN